MYYPHLTPHPQLKSFKAFAITIYYEGSTPIIQSYHHPQSNAPHVVNVTRLPSKSEGNMARYEYTGTALPWKKKTKSKKPNKAAITAAISNDREGFKLTRNTTTAMEQNVRQ